VSEEQELTDTDWRTLRDTLRGSIAMFDMLLAAPTAARRRAWWVMRVAGARRFSKRSRGACAADRGDLISRWFGRGGSAAAFLLLLQNPPQKTPG
jgi:hypothetical protein